MNKLLNRTFKLVGSSTGLLAIGVVLSQIIITYILNTKYPNPYPTTEEILNTLYLNRTLALTDMILSMLLGVFVIPTTIAFFIYLREKKIAFDKWLVIPLLSQIIGAITIIIAYILQLIIVLNFATSFHTVIEVEIKNNIKDLYLIYATTVYALSVVFYFLLFGVGTAFYAYFSLKADLIRSSLNWIALIGAVFTIGRFGIFIDYIFGLILVLIAQIGSITFLFWLTRICFDMISEIRAEKLGFKNDSTTNAD